MMQKRRLGGFIFRRSIDTIRHSPAVIIIPIIMFVILAGVSTWAVLWSAELQETALVTRAHTLAKSTVLSVEISLFVSLQPILTIAILIREWPQWGDLKPRFERVAPSVMAAASNEGIGVGLPSTLQLGPFGTLSASEPKGNPFAAANAGSAFSDPNRIAGVLQAVLVNDTAMSWSPSPARIFARLPVFIGGVQQTELWGQPDDDGMRENCSACYRPDLRQKLWGFSAIVMDPSSLIDGSFAPFASLTDQNFVYKLFRPSGQSDSTGGVLIGQTAGDDVLLDDMLLQVINLPDTQWFFYLAPAGGWKARATPGLAVITVFVSAVAAVFMSMILMSRKQHSMLLLSLVPQAVVDRLQNSKTYDIDTEYHSSCHALLDSGTPADKILDMMTQLLAGVTPSLQDVILIRTAMMQSFDLYAPIGINERIFSTVADANVGAALVALVGRVPLGANSDAAPTSPATAGSGAPARVQSFVLHPGAGQTIPAGEDEACRVQQLLRSTLHAIVSGELEESDRASNAASANCSEAQGYFFRSSAQSNGRGSAPTTRPLSAPMPEPGAGRPPDDNKAAFATREEAVLPVPERPSFFSDGAGAQDVVGSPPAPIMEEVERLLCGAGSWKFDVFLLDEATHGRPLSTLAFFLFSSSGLIQSFSLPTKQLVRFLMAIEDGYNASNPYHNAKHAADVLQSMHVILTEGGLLQTSSSSGYADELTLMACYIAAAVHDFEHGGSTNDFLILQGDALAMTYNDKSPLENHHLSASCKRLYLPDMNFIQHLQAADFNRLRKLLIDLVMSTDMKQHFSIVSQFGTLHRIHHARQSSADGSRLRPRPSQRCVAASASLASSASQVSVGDASFCRVPLDDTERLLSLQMALKLADLGHLSAPLHVHLRWVAALEEEFFRQGDAEKACGLPVSPLFDRTKPGITKSQVGFFDVVVLPCYQTFVTTFEGCKPLLKGALANYQHWAPKLADSPTSSSPAQGNSPLSGRSRLHIPSLSKSMVPVTIAE
ncbi:MAG: hypothetical protein WDW36_008285 [Sanguina aurantia]